MRFKIAVYGWVLGSSIAVASSGCVPDRCVAVTLEDRGASGVLTAALADETLILDLATVPVIQGFYGDSFAGSEGDDAPRWYEGDLVARWHGFTSSGQGIVFSLTVPRVSRNRIGFLEDQESRFCMCRRSQPGELSCDLDVDPEAVCENLVGSYAVRDACTAVPPGTPCGEDGEIVVDVPATPGKVLSGELHFRSPAYLDACEPYRTTALL